jgi:hypothetical protein
MTPKEKAKQLVKKFTSATMTLVADYEWVDDIFSAKQCALIAVEFARQEFRDHCAAEIGTNGSPDDHFDVLKQEIELL